MTKRQEGRPRITGPIVEAMFGSDHAFATTVYRGLVDVVQPLREAAPHLDLKEIIGSAAAFRALRKGDADELAAFLENTDSLYEIFAYAHRTGRTMQSRNVFQRINRNLDTSRDHHTRQEVKDAFDRSNPYHGRDLELRLGRVSREIVDDIKEDLLAPPSHYLFEDQHAVLARDQNLPDGQVIVLGEFPHFSRDRNSRKNIETYAKEVAKILRTFPKEYAPVERPQFEMFR